MKVFISHQRTDSQPASVVAARLREVHGIECYLDVIDHELSRSGEALGEYLRGQLGRCSHLLAIVSIHTKESWWVPWEIGIATEKDLPLSTYASGACSLPDYLKKWPYLRSQDDLDKYARVAQGSAGRFREKTRVLGEKSAREDSTKSFYQELRAALRQY